jgi:F-type H+-transporting ATPase subunit delta
LIRQSIAKRYAKALFAAGEKDGKYKDYLRQMDELLTTITASPQMKKAILLPLLEMDKRKELLSDLVKAFSITPTVSGMLALLLDKNRMDYFPAIRSAYEEMVDQKEGRVKGVAYSPYPVPDAVKSRIEEALGDRLKKQVLLEIKEDEALIGGIKVVVGGIRIDGSVKRQLELLNESMMKE